MKKYLLSVLFLLAMFAGMRAQVANYTFAKSVGVYTPITGGTALWTSTYDNQISSAITIPSFTFDGVAYTQLYVSANGFITFGSAPAAATYSALSSSESYSGAVSALACDIAQSSAGSPEVRYQTIGSEFIIQWQDARRWNNTGERISFQIRLNTATNAINIVYGGTITTGSSQYVREVGLRGATNSFNNNINNLYVNNIPSGTSCNWSDVVTGNSNNSGLYFYNSNTSVVPVTGLMFSWTPPVNPSLAPVRVFSAVTGITLTSANLFWTAPTGATQYNVQYRIPGTCSWTNFSGNPVSTNSVSLTGLASSTNYQVRVQATDGTNATIWSHIPDAAGTGDGYTTTGTFKTLSPPCTSPTSQPTNLIFGAATSTSVGATFSAATPTVSNYLVIRTLGTVPTAPVDGTTYTTGTAALGGTVVSIGTATTISSTGLTGNTNYSYFVYAYNTGTCTPVYLATAPLNGTITTCVAAPGTATVSNNSQNSFNLTLGSSVGGGANPVTYTVDVATNNTFSSLVVGSPFTITAPTTSVSITGLTAGTQYFYRTIASNGCLSAYTSTTTNTTLNLPCVAPTSQATGLVLSSTTSTVNGTFTAVTSTLTSYLIVRTTGAIPTSPATGTVYATGTAALGGTIAAVGTSTTFTNTGLTPNTNYSYFVYTYNTNSCLGGPIYNTGSPLTGTVVTCVAAPGTATVSNNSQNSFNLTWGSSVGGGANPVIYTLDVSTNSTVATPIVGSPFTITAPSNSVSITGLTDNTKYYYRIMASNGCSSAYTSTANITTLTLPCVAPTAQPTGLLLSSTASTINGTFTAASPASTNYLVVRTLGAIPTAPVNNTIYTVSTAALGGTIVAVGTATTFVNTALVSNTNYSYFIYAYNTGTCAPVYLASTPLTGSIVTCVSAPGTGTVSGTTTTAFNLTFGSSVGGGANPVTYTIDVATNNTFASPVVGSPFVVIAPTSSISVSGLTANTQYFYRMIASNGCMSAYTSTAIVNTPCNATNVTYTQDFESITTPAIPGCTSVETIGSSNSWATSSPGAYGFLSKALTYTYNSSNPANSWFYTQGLNLTAGVSYRLTYRYGNNGGTTYVERLKVNYGTSALNTAMTNTLTDHPNITNNTSSITNFVDFMPATTGVFYVGFNAYSITNRNQLFVDDIIIEVTPTCFPPTAIATSSITSSGVKLSWTAPTQGTPVNYIWEVRTSGAPGSGAAAATGTVAAPTASTLVTGLIATTNYSVYVRSDCGSGDLSAWSSVSTFSTTALAVDLQVLQLQAPAVNVTGCYANSLPVIIQIKNNGTTNFDFSTNTATLTTAITGVNPQSFNTVISTGTLAANATQNVTVTSTYNMSAVGVYTINSSVVLASPDGNSLNDIMATTTRTTTLATPLPYSEGFLTTTSPTGWTTTGWSFGSSHGLTTNGIYANYDGFGDPGPFDLLRLGTISGSESLQFDYRILNYSSTYPGTVTPPTGNWGSIKIQVSTDCGSTFSTIGTIDNTTHTITTQAWTNKVYSLSSFAGQSVIVRALVTYGTGDYFIDMDNFNIATCFYPTALNASNITTTGADLTWTAPTLGTPSDYIWEVRTSGAAGTGTTGLVNTGTVTAPATSVTVTGLTLSTGYSVYVQSHCGGTDYSTWSTVKTFTTPAACPTPLNLTISNILGHQAVATWTAGATETLWDVYYGASPLTPPTAGTVPTVTTTITSYTMTGLNAVTGYSVYVRANCGSGSLSTWTAVKAFVTTVSCPAPTNVTLSAITPTTAVATWTAGGLEPSWFVKYSAPTTTATVSSPSYSLAGLTPSTTYSIQVRGYCGVADTSTWTTVKTFMTPCLPPNITSAIPGARCGVGTTTLGAIADPGAVVQWYTAAIGGTAIATGTVFTTPFITSSTNYYASAANINTVNEYAGIPSITANSSTNSNYGDHGIVFTTTKSNVTVLSSKLYVNGTGSITVSLRNSAGTELSNTSAISVTGSGSVTPVVFPINLTTTTPGSYQLIVKSVSSGITSLYVENAPSYPYISPSGGVSVTSGYWYGNDLSSHRYFYNVQFSYSDICESSRTLVTATVTAPPALSLTTGTTVCANIVSTLSVTSTASNYDSYIWSPNTNLYTDAAATTAYTGGTATTVYYKSGVNGSTTYTLNGSNSGTGCANIATTSMTTFVPQIIASVTPSVVCSGNNVNLMATTNVVSAGTATVGSGATTGSDYDAIFYHLYGGNKTQHLITAADLTAAGMAPGNITSVRINIPTGGNSYGGFAISTATTTNTNMSAGINNTASFSTVYSSTSYTTASGNNTFVFSSPLNWDGVSNIILQFCWSNNNSGGTDNFARVVSTGYVSTAYYRADNLTPSAICSGTTATGTRSSRPLFIFNSQVQTQGAGSLAWQWNPGAINTNTAVVNPLNAGSTPSVSVYTITGTDALTTCSGTAAVSVTVNPLPTTPVTVNSTQCGVAIPTASVSGGTSYKWYALPTSTTVIQSGASATFTNSINATTTWYVSSFNGTCESLRAMVTASVTTPDAVTATSTQTAICPGQSFVLTANKVGSNNTYAYTWTASPATGSGIVTSVTGATTSVMPIAPGNYAYLVTAVDGSCTATASITVTTIAPPAIMAMSSASIICVGTTATLTAMTPPAILGVGTLTTTGSGASGGSNVSPYSHYFGGYKGQYLLRASELTASGLLPGNITSLALNVASAGTTYTGFSINMAATTQTVATTTFVTPVTNVYSANATPVVGLNTYNFATPFVWNGTSNVIVEITWSNNNGGGTAAEVTYDATSFVSTSYYRADNQTPVTMAGQTTATGVISSRPSIRLFTTNPSNTFQWNPGAINGSTTTVTPNVTVSTPLSYTVSVVDAVTTCSNTTVLTVTANPTPTVTAVSSSSAICSGNSVSLTATGATTYTWMPAGGSASTATVTPGTTTIYTVTGTSLGCANTKTLSINVTATPTVIASASPTVICAGATVSLTATGAANYTWTPGSLLTGTTTVTPIATTVYTVTGSTSGCVGTKTVNVMVNNIPVINLNPSTTICTIAGSATLIATGTATAYVWSNGATTGTNVVTPINPTSYTVTGTNNCGTNTATTTVLLGSAPTVSVSTSAPTICNNNSAVLTASGTATSYTWSTGATSLSITVTPTITTLYIVTGYNACGTASATVIQNVDPCTGLEEVFNSDAISIYPNPAHEFITIAIPVSLTTNTTLVEVTDAIGKLVMKETLNTDVTTINLNKLEDGVYFFKVISNNQTVKVGKVVKH